MPDFQTRFDISKEIAATDHDIKRAQERGSDAARHIVKASVEELARVDFEVLTAAVDDLREARRLWLEAARRRKDLQALLDEG